MVRIATFNVNGVNGRLPVLLKWLAETRYDVVCLQELKTSDEKYPDTAIRDVGYRSIWHGQKSYNGVAILALDATPDEVIRGLPGDPDDTHSRYLEAQVGDLVVGCIYLPNGNPAPGPKFDYKLSWFERLLTHSRSLLDGGKPTILCGDFNVVPTDSDAAVPQRWRWDAVMFPESRAAYRQMLEQGWEDAIRVVHPDDKIYTYWNFGYPRGYDPMSGLRMDHLLISPALRPRLIGADVDKHVRGWTKPSDHAPAWIELADV